MTKNKYDFSKKTVLITGAGSGIGRAITKAYLDNGANVVIVGRRESALLETVSGYEKERYLIIAKDISIPENSVKIVESAVKHFGKIDVVVNNAAVLVNGEIQDMLLSDWEKIRSINIDAFVYLAQAVYPELLKSKGNLVATSSVSGSFGDWGQSAYNATKHAINGFVRSIALDWGTDGIRVNAVAPAFTKTEMTLGIGNTEKELQPFINRIALGRPGRPEDVAPAVLFLSSGDATYITGTILTVDGGTSASSGQPHIG
ncbi:SDR family NAD(P)-dependent oxidoreductase [Liquorilactobacillus cacaonum]|uniref:Oxidoreductaseshort chain dehydrogenase reductase family n=1 Tax=Liquorilactobacillus cacaonum DSM 21116 TaxID=1423729 RepID=A0A0R2CL30_9LACO|nr:SDR family oxidoreductase [Liquorilactobacillus cacaonum]KRM90660.1 oxidoreductaseshort chain dehydrogenase reductase family [Liquorilactobacillus cacaonum DSM 21116]